MERVCSAWLKIVGSVMLKIHMNVIFASMGTQSTMMDNVSMMAAYQTTPLAFVVHFKSISMVFVLNVKWSTAYYAQLRILLFVIYVNITMF